MDNPTDAAVEALTMEFSRVFHQDTHDGIRAIARHVLTRQPGPEDVERIAQILAEADDFVWANLPETEDELKRRREEFIYTCRDDYRKQARAILALYAPPPTPARAPTRSALDPMLGNTGVRKAVVDAVLELFEDARRPLTEAQIWEITKGAYEDRRFRQKFGPAWEGKAFGEQLALFDTTRYILAAASWQMAAPTDSAASDRLAWLEKTHIETMDQNLQLIVERDALNARIATLEAELTEAKYNIGDTTWWRHKKRGSVYMELCRAELQSSMPLDEGDTMVVYSGEDGKFWTRPEDEFDDGRFERVGDPMTEPTGAVQAQAVTPPPSTIRLGDGLMEAQIEQIGKMVDSDVFNVEIATFDVNGELIRNSRGHDRFISTLDTSDLLKGRGLDVRTALRASATPKPEAVDWVKIAKDRSHTSEERYSSAEVITGLCEQIAALRAGGG